MQIGLGLPITRPTGGFNPRVVFGDGSNGLLWDYSATTGLYSDNLGATPLTAPDTGVGLVADLSRVRSPVTAYGGAQASAGFMPKWGRAPVSRRNLLTYTQQFDNAAWVLANTGAFNPIVTPDVAIAPDGSPTADRIQLNKTGGSLSRIQHAKAGLPSDIYTFSVWLRKNGTGTSNVGIRVYLTGINCLVTETWQRFSVTMTFAATIADAQILLWDSIPGNGETADVFAWGAQLETGSTATAYQAVTSTYDMTEAGVPSYGYIRPDRTDDVLTTTLTLAQTGDVAVFGRNGSWLETAKVYGAGSTFSIGPTTVTGLTAGLLAALGDIVGIVAIGRTLTAAELASTLAYFKARGAAGWLTAGANIATVSSVTGVAIGGPAFTNYVISTAMVIGFIYEISFTVSGYSGSGDVGIAGGASAFEPDIPAAFAVVSGNGTVRVIGIAATATAIQVFTRSTNTANFSSISVKPFTVAP
jgi:hypothetical protein